MKNQAGTSAFRLDAIGQNVISWLITITTSIDIYMLLVSIIIIGGVVYGFIRFLIWKEIRLFFNRKRPIMIFKSHEQSMEIETKLLRDTGLFTIREEPVEHHQ